MMNKKNLLKVLSILLITLFTSIAYGFSHNTSFINERAILSHAPNLDPQALKYSIKGYTWALQHYQVNNKNILTVIDFNRRSDTRRVWVINLKTSRVLMNLFTTQGKGSGTYYAKHFSNQARTNATSLGVYKTLNSYYGQHGFSERLQGLEQGINSNAYRRSVVVHPAQYASPRFIAIAHRAGLSWGCFALDPAVSKKFIQLTRGGSIIFAYASPERRDPYIANA